MSTANPERGEVALTVGGQSIVLRPSFQALVAAEGELGSLFALIDRAAEGGLRLEETTALLHHVAVEDVSRAALGQALVELGLARTAGLLRSVLTQVLQGR